MLIHFRSANKRRVFIAPGTHADTHSSLLQEHDGNLGYRDLAANNKQLDSAFICLLVIVCIYLYTVITAVSVPPNLNSGYAIAAPNGGSKCHMQIGIPNSECFYFIWGDHNVSVFWDVTPYSLVDLNVQEILTNTGCFRVRLSGLMKKM
jgi:hypothetical protein